MNHPQNCSKYSERTILSPILLHSAAGGYTCTHIYTRAHTYCFFSFMIHSFWEVCLFLFRYTESIHPTCKAHNLIPSGSFFCLCSLQLNNKNKDTVKLIFLLLISCTSCQLFQSVHFYNPLGNFCKVLFLDHLLNTISLISKDSPLSLRKHKYCSCS